MPLEKSCLAFLRSLCRKSFHWLEMNSPPQSRIITFGMPAQDKQLSSTTFWANLQSLTVLRPKSKGDASSQESWYRSCCISIHQFWLLLFHGVSRFFSASANPAPGWHSIWMFPKIVVPQIIHFNRVFHYNHPFWGTTIFGNTHSIWCCTCSTQNHPPIPGIPDHRSAHKLSFCLVALRR